MSRKELTAVGKGVVKVAGDAAKMEENLDRRLLAVEIKIEMIFRLLDEIEHSADMELTKRMRAVREET